MTAMLQQGDYVLTSAGELSTRTGWDQVLQRVLIKLTARRGQFPLLPQLGSRLYLLLRQPAARRDTLAREYVAEALSDEAGLSVSEVTLSDTEQGAQLTVLLNAGGTSLTAQVELT